MSAAGLFAFVDPLQRANLSRSAMPNNPNHTPSTSPLITRHADGTTKGRHPQDLKQAELAAAGHTPQPILKVSQAKCLDCSGGSRSEAAACTAVTCPLWPYRLGSNPSSTPRGLSLPGPDRSSEKVPQTAEVSRGVSPSKPEGTTS